MGVIDPNHLERRFKFHQVKQANEAILPAFEDSFVRYLIIADRCAPGEYGLLLSRTRFVADLVDIADLDRRGRKYWEDVLTKTPALLGTFIASAVLKKLPVTRLEPLTPIDLGADIESEIKSFLEDYLLKWRMRNRLRAKIIDVNAVHEKDLHIQQTIAVAGSRVVGILDPFDTVSVEKSRGGVTAAAPAPPAAAVLPGAAPGEPPNPGAFVAHPRISVSGQATRGQALPFTVGYSDHPDPNADEQKRIRIEKPEPGETVLVIASAEGATIDEPAFGELDLDLADEHEFTAHVSPDASSVSLRAHYLFRNKPIGHIVRSVPMADAQPAVHGVHRSTSLNAKPPFVRSLGEEAEIDDVDLILFVERSEPGHVSWKAYLPQTRKVHESSSIKLGDSERFAKGLADMRKLYGDSGSSAHAELKTAGQEIAACIPQEIMTVLLSVLAQPQAPTILIMTDQAFVPWELARFKSDKVNGNKPAFLGELARVGRWWTAASLSGPRSSRSIGHVSAVAATQYGLNTSYQTLEHAKAESEWLHTHFQATRIEATLPNIEKWLDTKPRPTGHLGHIALHGYSDTSADLQGLILADGKVLTPSRLAGEYYEGDTPRFEMLFLNACQVGTAGERLGRIAGFPGAILRAGAAAFIGPLWEVQDSVAEKVAEQFYKRVLGSREEIGETLRQLRSEPSMRDSITPWAYLFYGHPRLRLTRLQ